MDINFNDIGQYRREPGGPAWHTIASDKPGTPGILSRSDFEKEIGQELMAAVSEIVEERTIRASELLQISLDFMKPEGNGGLTSVCLSFGLQGDRHSDEDHDHQFIVHSSPDRIVHFDAEGAFEIDKVELERVVDKVARAVDFYLLPFRTRVNLAIGAAKGANFLEEITDAIGMPLTEYERMQRHVFETFQESAISRRRIMDPEARRILSGIYMKDRGNIDNWPHRFGVTHGAVSKWLS